MSTENKPKKAKLSLTEKELIFLKSMIGHALFNAEENSSLESNGDEEVVDHYEKNTHEPSALSKLNEFLRNLKPNKSAKLIPRRWRKL